MTTTPGGPPANGPGYVLGHTESELRRLAVQAQLVDPMTVSFLRAGGIRDGMRVLDVGCGAGHVSFLAADLVGADGQVVGVDTAGTAVAAAAEEAGRRGLTHVSFRRGDPVEMALDGAFDAVIGRFVLQFQPDPAAFLRGVARHVRAGGSVVFHELDWDGPWSFPPSPTHDQVCGWARETLQRSGAQTAMGRRLRSAFVEAGLPEPSLRLEAVIAGGDNALLPLEQVSLLVASLVPAMQEHGVATAEQVAVETLLERMTRETFDLGAVIIGRLQVGAWVRA